MTIHVSFHVYAHTSTSCYYSLNVTIHISFHVYRLLLTYPSDDFKVKYEIEVRDSLVFFFILYCLVSFQKCRLLLMCSSDDVTSNYECEFVRLSFPFFLYISCVSLLIRVVVRLSFFLFMNIMCLFS